MIKAAIIGGGASGLFAAAVISKFASVTVFEGNEKTGKKLYITGKGRCNFTNLCSPDEFIASVVRGNKFLYSAINAFTPKDAVEFFEKLGVKSKVERGDRVFPISDKASDISAALNKEIERNGGTIRLNTKVKSIEKYEKFIVDCGEKEQFDVVVLATGGVSYPQTGSSGDGYKFASSFGHKIIPPTAALCPLLFKEDVSSLEGLSLKNVNVKVTAGKKSWTRFGEMLFTDKGASGPCVLTLSSLISKTEGEKTFSIDLKPALSPEELDRRLLRDFSAAINKDFKNSLNDLLPKSLIPYIINKSGIDPEKKVNSVTKAERARLINLIKDLTFTVDRAEKIDYAIITCGGVDLKEVDPKTMESKLVGGLYIVGELLDVDALTGGFNLHIAWATAFAAAKHIGEYYEGAQRRD